LQPQTPCFVKVPAAFSGSLHHLTKHSRLPLQAATSIPAGGRALWLAPNPVRSDGLGR